MQNDWRLGGRRQSKAKQSKAACHALAAPRAPSRRVMLLRRAQPPSVQPASLLLPVSDRTRG